MSDLTFTQDLTGVTWSNLFSITLWKSTGCHMIFVKRHLLSESRFAFPIRLCVKVRPKFHAKHSCWCEQACTISRADFPAMVPMHLPYDKLSQCEQDWAASYYIDFVICRCKACPYCCQKHGLTSLSENMSEQPPLTPDSANVVLLVSYEERISFELQVLDY